MGAPRRGDRASDELRVLELERGKQNAATQQLALQPGPLAPRAVEPLGGGAHLEGLAEPDQCAVVGKLPGQGFRHGGRPAPHLKPDPGVHEVCQQQVVGPVAILVIAKGPG
jgi:hypothetical protein